MSCGILYVNVTVSRGTALKPCLHFPFSSGKTMWSRWLVESMFLPSQQLGNSWIRLTFLPFGQIGYLFMITLSSKPSQVHESLAFFGPFWLSLASPYSTRRNLGMAETLPASLPTHVTRAPPGSWMTPSLPSSSLLLFSPCCGLVSVPGSGLL